MILWNFKLTYFTLPPDIVFCELVSVLWCILAFCFLLLKVWYVISSVVFCTYFFFVWISLYLSHLLFTWPTLWLSYLHKYWISHPPLLLVVAIWHSLVDQIKYRISWEVLDGYAFPNEKHSWLSRPFLLFLPWMQKYYLKP